MRRRRLGVAQRPRGAAAAMDAALDAAMNVDKEQVQRATALTSSTRSSRCACLQDGLLVSYRPLASDARARDPRRRGLPGPGLSLASKVHCIYALLAGVSRGAERSSRCRRACSMSTVVGCAPPSSAPRGPSHVIERRHGLAEISSVAFACRALCIIPHPECLRHSRRGRVAPWAPFCEALTWLLTLVDEIVVVGRLRRRFCASE